MPLCRIEFGGWRGVIKVYACVRVCNKRINLVTVRAADFRIKRERHRCPVQAKQNSSF